MVNSRQITITILFALFCAFFLGNISWFEEVFYEIDRPATFTVIFLLWLVIMWIKKSKDKGYYALPTLKQYLFKHPECRTKEGIKCYVCNKIGFNSLDVEGTDKTKRRVVCPSCSTELYRKEYAPFVERGK